MRIDLSGNKYGRLTVLSFSGQKLSDKGNRCSMWNCVCDCGNTVDVAGSSLKNGTSKSCGCLQKELVSERASKHRLSKTRVYKIWGNMKTRCLNKNSTDYYLYGGRGITLCDRWMTFDNFFADMGIPSKDKSIDRINPNGNYEPSNCRWATLTEQANNKRTSRIISFNGIRRSLKEWARSLGLNESSLRERLKTWGLEKSLTEPKKRNYA